MAGQQVNKVIQAEKQAEAYELKLQGWTDRRIGEHMGVSHTTVQRWLKRAVVNRVLPLADAYRQQTLDKLALVERRLFEEIESGHAVARNAEVLVKVLERSARLLGADAPIQQEIATTVDTPPEVLDMIARAQELAARRSGAIAAVSERLDGPETVDADEDAQDA